MASVAEKINRTGNAQLQSHLDEWLRLIQLCITESAENKKSNMMNFCRSFVPTDVLQSTEDLEYFCNNLCTDEEYFTGLHRDLSQCASGQCVESIKPPTQVKRATYILLPLPGTG